MAPDARGDPDHPLQRQLVANGHHRPGVQLARRSTARRSTARSSAPKLAGLLPWQLTSRNKRNQHALETALCQSLQQKYLSSTIINRKYSELFSTAGLQPFYFVGLQPTKAKTQNKQNKIKFICPAMEATAGINWRKTAPLLFSFVFIEEKSRYSAALHLWIKKSR